MISYLHKDLDGFVSNGLSFVVKHDIEEGEDSHYCLVVSFLAALLSDVRYQWNELIQQCLLNIRSLCSKQLQSWEQPFNQKASFYLIGKVEQALSEF